MENTGTEQELGSSSTEVFKLPGEPAILINGVPDISPCDSTPVLCNTVNDAELSGNTVFGEWLEGRTVLKLFGEHYYSGMVAEFDKDAGWYRVVYDDGDFEDLDWHELEEVLLPLDITVPLRSLALKTIRKNKKLVNRSGKNVPQSRNYQAKNLGSKAKKIAEHDEASLTVFNSSQQVSAGGRGTISKEDE
ncbi:dirigent protein 17-like [Alnus glutinosa]|uniref:dirigent protein 17-like n=1 Tax=Alnus glutinosa TaxID=3517 RepID=UPI002D77A5F5|nr:dirigent protein 17-like [Alnus glutinosa]XP_062167176.1 dirigent protein 17-like [Alnus glutinosa]